MKYYCPMHPDVTEDESGKCPKCGMELVLQNTLQKVDRGLETINWKSYLPLIAIIGFIFIIAVVAAIHYTRVNFLHSFIAYFMGSFFLIFAFFKLIDLKGFAAGYSTYDLLAQRVFAYGYIYPFIELFFGIAMLTNYQSLTLLWVEIIVMTFSGIGVAIKLMKREKFQCVCLGTFLKIPLTKVTLIEDFGMAALAMILIFIS